MQNSLIRTTATALALVILSAGLPACSWFKEKPPEYVDAPEGEPLQVPETLDPPRYYAPIVVTHPGLRKPSSDELNPGPPRVASTGGGGDANAFLSWSAEGAFLQVGDTTESVQRRLKFVIERSGMRILDGADPGQYRFEYVHLTTDDRSFWQKMAFWNRGKGPNYSGIYRTRVVGDGEQARVFLLFDDGSSATTDAAEHVLGIFMERLG
jgi:uncharacterized lipoprotein